MAAREEARANAAEKEATLARMQLLEAQVEPHFLYNTLAHVVSLVDTDPPVAKRMLHRLIELLRATAASAQATVTLGRELDLVRAYLDLIAMRMGPRLAWSIDVPEDLAMAEVPPMLLQPVVENAIKHGLEPKMEGGRVDVRARRENGDARASRDRHGTRRRCHAAAPIPRGSGLPTCAPGSPRRSTASGVAAPRR